MAFGQQSGPPASRRQVEELVALVTAAGYDDLRQARHPLGLTQRQAAGRFTRDEADELIARLQDDGDGPGAPAPEPPSAADRARARHEQAARGLPSEVLAGELQRRGWAVIEP